MNAVRNTWQLSAKGKLWDVKVLVLLLMILNIAARGSLLIGTLANQRRFRAIEFGNSYVNDEFRKFQILSTPETISEPTPTVLSTITITQLQQQKQQLNSRQDLAFYKCRSQLQHAAAHRRMQQKQQLNNRQDSAFYKCISQLQHAAAHRRSTHAGSPPSVPSVVQLVLTHLTSDEVGIYLNATQILLVTPLQPT
ncbi:hypothetical protein RND71_028738 [Anisodus tanguticus]|uniref:Uncharacterized protein n=1 Tax=Anisodus tanguticus TaxID=243964 RepID=A0AAE1RKC4_9SOLA|nr:hypothetical protein RND71_028738 [Anisodus tanguticus]